MNSLSCAKDYYHFEIRKVVAVVFFFFFLYKSHKNSSFKTVYLETEKELTWAASLGSGDWKGFQGGK